MDSRTSRPSATRHRREPAQADRLRRLAAVAHGPPEVARTDRSASCWASTADVLVQALKIAVSAGLSWALAVWLLELAVTDLGADHRLADRPADRPRVGPGRAGEGLRGPDRHPGRDLAGRPDRTARLVDRADRGRRLPGREGVAAQRWRGGADPDQRPVRAGAGQRAGRAAVPGHADRRRRRRGGELRHRPAQLRRRPRPGRWPTLADGLVEVLATIADGITRPWTSTTAAGWLRTAREQGRFATAAESDVDKAAQSLHLHPGRSSWASALDRLQQANDTLQIVEVQVRTLARTVRDIATKVPRQDGSQPPMPMASAMLTAAADAIEAFAHTLLRAEKDAERSWSAAPRTARSTVARAEDRRDQRRPGGHAGGEPGPRGLPGRVGGGDGPDPGRAGAPGWPPKRIGPTTTACRDDPRTALTPADVVGRDAAPVTRQGRIGRPGRQCRAATRAPTAGQLRRQGTSPVQASAARRPRRFACQLRRRRPARAAPGSPRAAPRQRPGRRRPAPRRAARRPPAARPAGR